MDQAGGMFELWADYQQNALQALAKSVQPLGLGMMGGRTADATQDLRDAQALWQSSLEQWVALARQSLPGAASADAALKALFDPAQWVPQGLGPLDQAIEHLVEGPSYATLWTLDRKMLTAQKLRAEWARDLAVYQVLMYDAWNKVILRFMEEVNDPNGTPLTGWRDLTDVWITVANDTLTQTHRTPEFLEAQRRLTRSGAECRLQERAIAETLCEMHQLPTRTEMDEVQQEVYALRREMRALRKGSGGAQAVAVNRPPPESSTRKRKRQSRVATTRPASKR
jgi:hypothetical protein